MDQSHINQVLGYPSNSPSAQELWVSYPKRLNELTEEEAEYLTKAATESMDQLAEHLLTESAGILPPGDQLLPAFMYAFDKGVEIVYKMKSTPDVVTDFKLEDISESEADQVPEFIQLKVTPILSVVATIFKETTDFAEQEASTILDAEDLCKSILVGGMLLGVEFCLRQDLNDDQ